MSESVENNYITVPWPCYKWVLPEKTAWVVSKPEKNPYIETNFAFWKDAIMSAKTTKQQSDIRDAQADLKLLFSQYERKQVPRLLNFCHAQLSWA